MTTAPPLWLASGSPRRRELLEAASIPFEVHPPDIDDGTLAPPPGVAPEAWVIAMAYLKGRRVADHLLARDPGALGRVLAADTVCVIDGVVLGQPPHVEAARSMLRQLRDRGHHTLTGVAMIDLATGRRWLLYDRSEVRIGAIADSAVEAYLRSGQWRGKAGGYNLADRVEAGWPIDCVGDSGTVMGLPMERITSLIREMEAEGS